MPEADAEGRHLVRDRVPQQRAHGGRYGAMASSIAPMRRPARSGRRAAQVGGQLVARIERAHVELEAGARSHSPSRAGGSVGSSWTTSTATCRA